MVLEGYEDSIAGKLLIILEVMCKENKLKKEDAIVLADVVCNVADCAADNEENENGCLELAKMFKSFKEILNGKEN